jgi:xanthine dehydrogenase accessory factor
LKEMDRNTDIEVLCSAIDWLDEGSPVYLATVVGTWGSAPRRPGSMMVIHPDGHFNGSVSGGCIEDDLAQQVLRGELEHDLPRLIEYGVTRERIQQVGLPCGGRLKLLLERIDSVAPMRDLLRAVEQRKLVSRHVCLNTGEVSLQPSYTDRDFHFDGHNMVKVFGPGWRMLLIGAGELSRRVAQLAMTLDYAVTLCDSRPQYADSWQVEGAAFVTAISEQALIDLQPDPRTVVLALSHTPALDDAALFVALQSDAFYIGALGSLKNQQARLKRLQKKGLTAEQLARLHGPVGLDIGSRTPAEIAVAILAALIAERNQLGQLNTAPQSINA